MNTFKICQEGNKKYSVITPKGNYIEFGDKNKQHFKDKTPLQAYSYLNNYDNNKRLKYLNKILNIKDKNGVLKALNPEYPEYYNVNFLW